jgi:hypothetical protein
MYVPPYIFRSVVGLALQMCHIQRRDFDLFCPVGTYRASNDEAFDDDGIEEEEHASH